MLLSIITLNYKKSELTIRLLASINKMFRQELIDDELEVIIVDNKSPDNSVKIIQVAISHNKYKNMTLYQNKENAGFGRGNNYGAKKAKGKYFLFLNNDTMVKDRGIFEMAQYLEKHKEIAILGGQLRNFDGSLQPSSGKFYTPLNLTLLLMGAQKVGLLDKSPKKISEVQWVKGAVFMIRKEVFEKLGGFDPNIFMYTEDMELCYRAKLAGYKIYFYPYTQVFHIDQGSSNKTFAILNVYKNMLYFYRKHRTKAEYIYVKWLLNAKAQFSLFIGRCINNQYLISTYGQAINTVQKNS